MVSVNHGMYSTIATSDGVSICTDASFAGFHCTVYLLLFICCGPSGQGLMFLPNCTGDTRSAIS
jgi:hypothetical protein